MANQAVTLLVLFSLGLAPERPLRNPPMPNGPQPNFATVRTIFEAQKLVIVLHQVVVVVPVAVTAFENGQQVVKTAYRQEYRVEQREFALDKGMIYDAAGKKISSQEALKRLKVGATVLVARQPVDPLYLRVIRPETLILVSATAPAPFPIPAPFPKDKRGELKGEPPPKR